MKTKLPMMLLNNLYSTSQKKKESSKNTLMKWSAILNTLQPNSNIISTIKTRLLDHSDFANLNSEERLLIFNIIEFSIELYLQELQLNYLKNVGTFTDTLQ